MVKQLDITYDEMMSGSKAADYDQIFQSRIRKVRCVRVTRHHTSSEQIDFASGDDVIPINIEGVNPIFSAQTVRLLVPALFPDEVCILSDIDIMPLSHDYFVKTIKDFDENNFVIYRPDACPPEMLALCFNAALGKTWAEIFEVATKKEIMNKILKIYEKK